MRDTRRTRIVLAVLLLTAFTFITLDARGGEGSVMDRLRESASSVLGPIERAAGAVVNPVSDFIDGLTSINSNAETIDQLEAENAELRRQLLTTDLDRARVEELDKLLGIPSLGNYEIVPAQVIGVSAEVGYARSVTVDAGTRDGIQRDMTVLNGDGLVGRVVAAGPTTATVLLLSDPEFSVGARVASSQEMGILHGNGAEPLTLELYSGQAAISEGDDIFTTGSKNNRPFVPGVPIGDVTEVIATPGALSRQAVVEPFANLTALNVVGIVIEAPRHARRQPLVQPTPSPSPTPTTSPSTSASPSATPGASPSP
ncbi:MAG TPA: rod shape-determining protein MreC [Actinomycetes bacterium]|nr:rod shape-determining protein MreC [Actinomycetes bacterium]